MKILFMCVANSARSQMAEGLARHLFPNFDIESAGSSPSSVNPYAVQAMAEIGIDIREQSSKAFAALPEKFVADLDYLITLCEQEVCPVVLTTEQRIHWPIADPADAVKSPPAEILQKFRRARNAISDRLKDFKREIGQ